MPLPHTPARANRAMLLSYIMFNIIAYYSTRLLNKTKIIFFIVYSQKTDKIQAGLIMASSRRIEAKIASPTHALGNRQSVMLLGSGSLFYIIFKNFLMVKHEHVFGDVVKRINIGFFGVITPSWNSRCPAEKYN